MEKIPTDIPDVFIVRPNVYEDSRGYFYESFNKSKFSDLGIDFEFVQDNQSLSGKMFSVVFIFRRSLMNKVSLSE